MELHQCELVRESRLSKAEQRGNLYNKAPWVWEKESARVQVKARAGEDCVQGFSGVSCGSSSSGSWRGLSPFSSPGSTSSSFLSPSASSRSKLCARPSWGSSNFRSRALRT